MRIDQIAVRDVQTRLLQAYPKIKDELANIKRAEQTAQEQAKFQKKPAPALRLRRSLPLEFYEVLETEIVTAYLVTDIREEDVPTLLLAQVRGLRNIRPLALLLSVPQEGFDVSEAAICSIKNAGNLALEMNAPRGRGLEVFLCVYEKDVADTLLRKGVFF